MKFLSVISFVPLISAEFSFTSARIFASAGGKISSFSGFDTGFIFAAFRYRFYLCGVF